MNRDPAELMMPRILVVDDEVQIHASLRLRIGRNYDLAFSCSAADALEKISRERFELCFADIHMPEMDGISFINAARKVDAGLGYVIISAFDSDENLRRTIPLQVYDFVTKPLPERCDFEARIPGWIDENRRRRRELELAREADSIAIDRDSARLERDVELVASENARDALLQTASFLTTIHAHFVSATASVAARVRSDPSAMLLLRNLEEGKRTADAAMLAAESFFESAYGSRDTSPAFVNEGVRDAIGIATRNSRGDQLDKAIEFSPLESRLSIRGLSGIKFLLMVTPALSAALALAAPRTTVGVKGEHYARLDEVTRSSRFRSFIWLNRRNALASHAGVLLQISASAPPLTRTQIQDWVNGQYSRLATLTPRGLINGVQECQGLLGFSTAPETDNFRLLMALPT